MKKQLYLFGLLLVPFFIHAQNVGIGTTTPDPCAILDLKSTTQGLLLPAMSSSNRTAIASPANGLMVYDFTTKSIWMKGTSGWDQMVTKFNNAWQESGNDVYHSVGNVGIGTEFPAYRLQVNESTSANSYMNITNTNTGSSGTDGLLMGLTGNAATLTNLENGSLQFGTNNLTRVMIDATGNVGIGLLTPIEKLDVSGNIKLTGEVNRTATSNANLVPIAWGNINPTGTININSSTNNFTVTRTSIGTYSIVISGETYHFASYSTIVTPVASTPRLATTGSGGGELRIDIYNLTGTNEDSNFSFIVYKK